MGIVSRREFLKRAGVALAGLTFPPVAVPLPLDQPPSDSPPGPLGRIATWWTQGVHRWPTERSERVALKVHDEVIPLYAAVVGDPPWPGNPVWYQTDEGFIHSGYVYPSEDQPSDEVIRHVPVPGFWAQVCVPIAEARWRPDHPALYRSLYYGTVYRVVSAVQDDEGNWWYRLQEGVTWSPGPYVPTWSVRRIRPQDVAPISPDVPDKWIEIDLARQTLTCLEGGTPVRSAPISSGLGGATPRGEFRVLRKRHTSRMIGGNEDDRYDLPGVAFPVYFTGSGIASHGTYWHNDFVRPHSHGCVNMTNQDAQWVFRWTRPVVPYEEFMVNADPDDATPIVVI
jgi:hypothetical protein